MKGIISVGSHNGQEYEKWLIEGFENFIFFEPVSFNFEKLKKNLPKSKEIKLYNLALGNSQGIVKMHIEKSNQGRSCSILEPHLHLKTNPKIKFNWEEIVKIDKLDNIEYDRNLFDYLHIYAQGYELEILKGSEKSLPFIETIELEVFKQEQYKGCVLFEDITKYLDEKGFELLKVDWYGTWGMAKFIKIK